MPTILTPMNAALKQAVIAYKTGEVPVGAVIVKDGKVISEAANAMIQNANPLAHAEILAINQAIKVLQTSYLTDCDIYITLEPCTMCAGAIALARLRRVYYGAQDIKGGAVENGVRFFNQPSCNHRPAIYSAIQEQECAKLLRDFFARLR
ncbi:nucleoside deaminase [Bartonella sp. TP]|uniref:nucleoside deaminase n=1 Tax=Bartonella sp. TP TaxID=3057550 RepID=UPI0025B031AB|nr:nucleoside deaminase [Bartonella sp. TP]WJW80354.1 nucleoside deaminase [Bartonella sp. TP]